ncbi:MAG TPA: hypothetical protein GX524_02785 [Firmicutes bacterium]|jgi:hypothetical protein|nr:hypothetical protein [Bacillota bacterium]
MRRKQLFSITMLVIAGALLGWFGKGLASPNAPLPGSQEDPLVTRAYVDSKLKMTVVDLSPGNTLIGYSGTEIILRAGKGTIVDSEMGGLCDLTQGVDLRNGSEAPKNHLLLVPRDDGRGIKAASQATVMVRGSFTVK